MNSRALPVFAILLLAAAAARADHWTAVASTGTVDESAAGIFEMTGPSLGYLGGSPSLNRITARYNVTNTAGQELPPWTTLELGYFDAAPGSSVNARLVRVKPCTGTETTLCTAFSVDSPSPTCVTCTIPTGTLDFANYLYYVEVSITRNSTTQRPQAITLRVY